MAYKQIYSSRSLERMQEKFLFFYFSFE